jgi:hypothetical protein
MYLSVGSQITKIWHLLTLFTAMCDAKLRPFLIHGHRTCHLEIYNPGPESIESKCNYPLRFRMCYSKL